MYCFSQLFGELDPENEDISPDTNDPEAKSDSAGDQVNPEPEELKFTNGSENSSLWSRVISSMECSQNFEESLLMRLFNADIKTLLSMDSLWKARPDRKEPSPLEETTVKAAQSHPGLCSITGTSFVSSMIKIVIA